MPDTMTTVTAPQVLGKQYKKTSTVTGDNVHKSSPSLGVAKIGQLTTRTSVSVGTLTMNGGHGFTTAAIIDLYWTGGSRRGVVVGTVATNSVPISGGAGDDLPTNLTAITAMVQTTEGVTIVGANVKGIIISAGNVQGQTGGAVCAVTFQQANGTLIYGVTLDGTNDFQWDSNSLATNPVTGQTIGLVSLTHADSAGSHSVEAILLYN